MGSTSHLQNPLLQTIRALASTIKIHITDIIEIFVYWRREIFRFDLITQSPLRIYF